MNARRARVGAPGVLAGLLLSLTPAAAATVHTPGTPPATPDTCVERNAGDAGACNVGRSGRGDQPYLPVPAAHSVAACIQLNEGDARACHLGSTGERYGG